MHGCPRSKNIVEEQLKNTICRCALPKWTPTLACVHGALRTQDKIVIPNNTTAKSSAFREEESRKILIPGSQKTSRSSLVNNLNHSTHKQLNSAQGGRKRRAVLHIRLTTYNKRHERVAASRPSQGAMVVALSVVFSASLPASYVFYSTNNKHGCAKQSHWSYVLLGDMHTAATSPANSTIRRNARYVANRPPSRTDRTIPETRRMHSSHTERAGFAHPTETNTKNNKQRGLHVPTPTHCSKEQKNKARYEKTALHRPANKRSTQL